jgi:hypothetical protein
MTDLVDFVRLYRYLRRYFGRAHAFQRAKRSIWPKV